MYVDDWLGSAKIQMMDALEERGYLRLLMRAATAPSCSVPDDNAQLAVISLLGSQWYKPTKEKLKRIEGVTSGMKLRHCFAFRPDGAELGRLYNERLYREWMYQKAVSDKRSAAAKLANGVRWRSASAPPLVPNGSQSDPNIVLVSDGVEVVSKKKKRLYDRYRDFLEQWPEHKIGEVLGAQVWMSLVDSGEITEVNIHEVFEGLERFKASHLWAQGGGKYIPSIANTKIDNPGWLQKRSWKDHPKAAGEDAKWA